MTLDDYVYSFYCDGAISVAQATSGGLQLRLYIDGPAVAPEARDALIGWLSTQGEDIARCVALVNMPQTEVVVYAPAVGPGMFRLPGTDYIDDGRRLWRIIHGAKLPDFLSPPPSPARDLAPEAWAVLTGSLARD